VNLTDMVSVRSTPRWRPSRQAIVIPRLGCPVRGEFEPVLWQTETDRGVRGGGFAIILVADVDGERLASRLALFDPTAFRHRPDAEGARRRPIASMETSKWIPRGPPGVGHRRYLGAG
jgi:hypothetical protein